MRQSKQGLRTKWDGARQGRSKARYLESSAIRPCAESARWSLIALPGTKARGFAFNLRCTMRESHLSCDLQDHF